MNYRDILEEQAVKASGPNTPYLGGHNEHIPGIRSYTYTVGKGYDEILAVIGATDPRTYWDWSDTFPNLIKLYDGSG